MYGRAVGGDDARDAGGAAFESLSEDERAVVLKVVEVLRKVKFGTVLLVVQDGKVVQIEMAEKIRLR